MRNDNFTSDQLLFLIVCNNKHVNSKRIPIVYQELQRSYKNTCDLLMTRYFGNNFYTIFDLQFKSKKSMSARA